MYVCRLPCSSAPPLALTPAAACSPHTARCGRGRGRVLYHGSALACHALPPPSAAYTFLCQRTPVLVTYPSQHYHMPLMGVDVWLPHTARAQYFSVMVPIQPPFAKLFGASDRFDCIRAYNDNAIVGCRHVWCVQRHTALAHLSALLPASSHILRLAAAATSTCLSSASFFVRHLLLFSPLHGKTMPLFAAQPALNAFRLLYHCRFANDISSPCI